MWNGAQQAGVNFALVTAKVLLCSYYYIIVHSSTTNYYDTATDY